MGQRSQIYVKVNDELVIARYFQWNYGTRMISRARYGIEFIANNIGHDWYFDKKNFDFKKLERIWDVNFDYKNIVLSQDILEEWKEDSKEYFSDVSFSEYVFDSQDNNDGKLFVQVDTKIKEIKYCLTDYEGKILSATQYMDWDEEKWLDEDNQYIGKTERNTCLKNIKKIDKIATLMTKKELEKFKNVKNPDLF